MGCCPSSPYKADHAATHHHHPSRSDHSRRSKVAPPDEETVKEVLSETPISKTNGNNEDKQRGGFTKPAVLHKHDDPKKPDNKAPFMNNNKNAEEASEVSEICSLSEVSVSTAADGGEEVRQREVNRSPARVRSRERRDRAAAGKSPARRSDPSPGRARSVSGPDGRRRDVGESSGRRSMSPATRGGAAESGGGGRVAMGRSSSARRTGKSPGRVQGKTWKFEEATEGEIGNGNSSNKWHPPTGDESLENPLVSLECFIFL